MKVKITTSIFRRRLHCESLTNKPVKSDKSMLACLTRGVKIMEVNMNGLQVRYQQIGDAKRFYEILRHPDFVLFSVKPCSINFFLLIPFSLALPNFKHLDIY